MSVDSSMIGPTVALRKYTRFFGPCGICDMYERRGDQLIQFGDIAAYVADAAPDMTRAGVSRRFLLSVKMGWFGRRWSRGVIDRLIDLDSRPDRVSHSLRPSYLTVEAAPLLMRARRSVWVAWLKAEGWPVPQAFGAPAVETKARSGRKRGRKATVLDRVTSAMRSFGSDAIAGMSEEAQAAQFSASRDTCRRARQALWPDIN